MSRFVQLQNKGSAIQLQMMQEEKRSESGKSVNPPSKRQSMRAEESNDQLYDFDDSLPSHSLSLAHTHNRLNAQTQQSGASFNDPLFAPSSASSDRSLSLSGSSLPYSPPSSSSFPSDSSYLYYSSSSPAVDQHFHYYYFNRDLDRQKKSSALLSASLVVLLAIILLTLGHSDRSIGELASSRPAQAALAFLSDSLSSVSSEDLAELKDNFQALDATLQAQAVSFGHRVARAAPTLLAIAGSANLLIALKKALVGENKRKGTGASKSFLLSLILFSCALALPFFQ